MIYALVHPDTLEVRYIWKTRKTQVSRFKEHAAAARRGRRTPLYGWWRKLEAEVGHPPAAVRLGDGDPVAEREWIAKFKEAGARLLNMTPGGDGGPTRTGQRHTPEAKEKMRAAWRNTPARDRYHHAPRSTEVRTKLSVAQTGKKHSAETKAKLSAYTTAHPPQRSETWRENVRAALRRRNTDGSMQTPEMRARRGIKISAGHARHRQGG